jgi:hypothetical protein
MSTIQKLTTFRGWLYGLLAAIIGGTASAGLSFLTMNGAAASGIDVPTLNFKALGIILLSSGLVSMFAYLKQSPLPDPVPDRNDRPPVGPVASLILCGLLLGSLFTNTGCVSTGVRPQTVDAISAGVRPVAKNVVNLVLTKNPSYDTALLALAAAADAALNGGALTQASIRGFVEAFAVQHGLDAQTKLYIASGIDDLAQFYRDTYGQTVADTADPNVRKILAAFSAGIRDGVSLFHALRAGGTS